MGSDGERCQAIRAPPGCGWLKDRSGLSWKVVAKNIGKLLKSPAAIQAMIKRKTLDIAILGQA